MGKDFYEFYHECEDMPEDIVFCKLDGCKSSQFTVSNHSLGAHTETTTIYNFKYCPYCGEKVTD